MASCLSQENRQMHAATKSYMEKSGFQDGCRGDFVEKSKVAFASTASSADCIASDAAKVEMATQQAVQNLEGGSTRPVLISWGALINVQLVIIWWQVRGKAAVEQGREEGSRRGGGLPWDRHQGG